MSTYHAHDILEKYKKEDPLWRAVRQIQNITPPPGGVTNLPKIESLSDLYDD